MTMTKLSKRLDDLSDAIKNTRIGDERVKFIEIRGDGWIEGTSYRRERIVVIR